MNSGATDDCEAFAAWLKAQALWPAIVVVAVFVALPPAAYVAGLAMNGAAIAILSVASLCGLASLWFSAMMRFDAALFSLMASHGEEGGKAVDDILQRMRLKPMPAETRATAERMAGARRLVTRQRLALAAFVAAIAFLPAVATP